MDCTLRSSPEGCPPGSSGKRLRPGGCSRSGPCFSAVPSPQPKGSWALCAPPWRKGRFGAAQEAEGGPKRPLAPQRRGATFSTQPLGSSARRPRATSGATLRPAPESVNGAFTLLPDGRPSMGQVLTSGRRFRWSSARMAARTSRDDRRLHGRVAPRPYAVCPWSRCEPTPGLPSTGWGSRPGWRRLRRSPTPPSRPTTGPPRFAPPSASPVRCGSWTACGGSRSVSCSTTTATGPRGCSAPTPRGPSGAMAGPRSRPTSSGGPWSAAEASGRPGSRSGWGPIGPATSRPAIRARTPTARSGSSSSSCNRRRGIWRRAWRPTADGWSSSTGRSRSSTPPARRSSGS